MDLIDIGANLGHESFDADLDAVLQRAVRAGVRRLVVTGASRAGAVRALELAKAHPGLLWATAGIHPHHATECTAEGIAELRALQAEPEVVAAGECGLDYHRDFSPRPAQRSAFERQLELAAETRLPLFLHQRDAHGDFMGIMKAFEGQLGPVVVHCFTGTRAECFDYLDQDWHIGITGWLCDERRGQHLREFVKDIPGAPADGRDRCALPAAAQREAHAQPPPQRADVPGAHRRGAGPRPRRGRGDHRRGHHGHRGGVLPPA